jgi:hypothetical protein
MKKTARRPNHTRLRSIDTAQLSQVSGGNTVQDLTNAGLRFGAESGWRQFFDAAAAEMNITHCTCTCTPPP